MEDDTLVRQRLAKELQSLGHHDLAERVLGLPPASVREVTEEIERLQERLGEARDEARLLRHVVSAWGVWLVARPGSPAEGVVLRDAISRMPAWATRPPRSPPEPRKAPAKGSIQNLQGDDMIAALEVWGGLACRGRYPSPKGQYEIPRDPVKASDHIEHWADLVFYASGWAEGLDAPTASCTRGPAATKLTWKGQWTEGRWLTVSIEETTGPHSAPCASISWDSGTGEPSTFLGGILGDLLDQVEGS